MLYEIELSSDSGYNLEKWGEKGNKTFPFSCRPALYQVMVFCLKLSHNHPHFLLSVQMPYCLIQTPLFPNYSTELPTFFPLPRSSRYSVRLLSQERCSQSFCSKKWQPLNSGQPELEEKLCFTHTL